MTVNAILVALVLAFAAWEVLAGIVASGPFERMTSVSEFVWAFEARYGTPARLTVGAALVLLALHLIVGWPLGPS